MKIIEMIGDSSYIEQRLIYMLRCLMENPDGCIFTFREFNYDEEYKQGLFGKKLVRSSFDYSYNLYKVPDAVVAFCKKNGLKYTFSKKEFNERTSATSIIYKSYSYNMSIEVKNPANVLAGYGITSQKIDRMAASSYVAAFKAGMRRTLSEALGDDPRNSLMQVNCSVGPAACECSFTYPHEFILPFEKEGFANLDMGEKIIMEYLLESIFGQMLKDEAQIEKFEYKGNWDTQGKLTFSYMCYLLPLNKPLKTW